MVPTHRSRTITTNQTASDPAAADQTGANVRVLEGCLVKGPAADEYTLQTEGPNSWELRSDNLYLAAYVDETVRLTVLNKPADDGTYVVTDVSSVILTSCTQ